MPERDHIADAPPEPTQRLVLYLLAALGLACVIVGWAADAFTSLSFGLYLLTYCAVVAASWLPPGRLSGRVDDFLDDWIRNVASGFYGLVALSVFAAMELGDLFGDIADFSVSRTAFSEFVIPWLIGFSIDSVMNMIWAGLWPMHLLSEAGANSTLVFAALAWGVFWGGSKVFPTEPLARRGEPTRLDAALERLTHLPGIEGATPSQRPRAATRPPPPPPGAPPPPPQA